LELIEIELLRKEVASKEDFALELFVELALCTGARLEGILNIKKKDLALSTKSVTISDFKTKSTYAGFLSQKAFRNDKSNLYHPVSERLFGK
jgi:site-specific recombinase, phage integrase family